MPAASMLPTPGAAWAADFRQRVGITLPTTELAQRYIDEINDIVAAVQGEPEPDPRLLARARYLRGWLGRAIALIVPA